MLRQVRGDGYGSNKGIEYVKVRLVVALVDDCVS
jgi:hypothetical protein